tara:strand:+ start:17994 stop:19142 length:1149 start_codon:yes stop_codon:yes gene_type:complete
MRLFSSTGVGQLAVRFCRSLAQITCTLALLLALFTLFAPAAVLAQEKTSDAPLTVGLYVSPPFVMEENGSYTGMAIDIWENLSRKLDLDFEYRNFENFGDLLDETAAGTVDVAVTNVTITRARAERVDFTQPWFDSGLRIMVNEDRGVGFRALVEGLSNAGYLRAYGWLALVIIGSTLLLTLFDRRFNKQFPSAWRDGVAESFYVVMSVATSGRMPGRPNLFGWIGRIMQALWLVCGIAVLAYVTSSVTSVMTSLSLTNNINSYADLRDRPVGVQSGSTAEEQAREDGLSISTYPGIEALATALLNEEIEAVIGDAPVLEYYATTHPNLPLNVVGKIFAPDKYGFALTRGSPHTKRMTVEILGAREQEQIEKLRKGYFGDDP